MFNVTRSVIISWRKIYEINAPNQVNFYIFIKSILRKYIFLYQFDTDSKLTRLIVTNSICNRIDGGHRQHFELLFKLFRFSFLEWPDEGKKNKTKKEISENIFGCLSANCFNLSCLILSRFSFYVAFDPKKPVKYQLKTSNIQTIRPKHLIITEKQIILINL